MVSESMKKIGKIIAESNSVALVLGDNFEEHELLAREALKLVLHSQNKSVHLLPEPSNKFIEKWSPLLTQGVAPLFRHFSKLRILKKGISIKEVSYENEEDSLLINIISEEGGITEGNLFLEPVSSQADGVVSFGQIEEDKFVKKHKNIILPDEDKFVFVEKNMRPIAEKVYNIIRSIGSGYSHHPHVFTVLLASLLLEVDNKVNHHRWEEFVALEGSLLSMGADKNIVAEILQKEKDPFFANLFGRALARTRSSDKLKSIWTFISSQDIEKSGQKSLDDIMIYQISQKLYQFISYQPLSLIFWQNRNGIKCLINFTEQSKDLAMLLSEKLGIPFQNKFLITGSFVSFSEAEIKLQQALKEIV